MAFLIAGVCMWIISAILAVYIGIFVFKEPAVSLFGSSCNTTGLPILLCLDEFDSSRYVFYFINISFWFLVAFAIWRFFNKR